MNISIDEKEVIWAQKYRPQKLDEMILPKAVKEQIAEAIETKEIPHYIFASPAGYGKTTLANVIANETGSQIFKINASLETGIDAIRAKVIDFAATKNVFGGGRKIVILDEADKLSASAMASLKGILEDFSKNTSFILTTNHLNKIIDPIKSRCNTIEFKIPDDEKKELLVEAYKRVAKILEMEGVEFDKKIVGAVLKKHFPDMRRVLVALQKASIDGKLTDAALIDYSVYDDLVDHVLKKDWQSMCQWVAEKQADFDFSDFYEHFSKKVDDKSILPVVVVLTAKYDYQNGFVTDKMINIKAYLTELMGEL